MPRFLADENVPGDAIEAARLAGHDLEWIRELSPSAATRRLEALLIDLRAQGLDVARVAVVGAPDRKLASIGNPHIRAHAAEGVLFRRVWQVAAQAVGVPSMAFAEKGIESFAAARLGVDVETLRARIAEFGQAVGRPWRADEKAAAMAAWMALSGLSAV